MSVGAWSLWLFAAVTQRARKNLRRSFRQSLPQVNVRRGDIEVF
jgi:hypothetical protein